MIAKFSGKFCQPNFSVECWSFCWYLAITPQNIQERKRPSKAHYATQVFWKIGTYITVFSYVYMKEHKCLSNYFTSDQRECSWWSHRPIITVRSGHKYHCMHGAVSSFVLSSFKISDNCMIDCDVFNIFFVNQFRCLCQLARSVYSARKVVAV